MVHKISFEFDTQNQCCFDSFFCHTIYKDNFPTTILKIMFVLSIVIFLKSEILFHSIYYVYLLIDIIFFKII